MWIWHTQFKFKGPITITYFNLLTASAVQLLTVIFEVVHRNHFIVALSVSVTSLADLFRMYHYQKRQDIIRCSALDASPLCGDWLFKEHGRPGLETKPTYLDSEGKFCCGATTLYTSSHMLRHNISFLLPSTADGGFCRWIFWPKPHQSGMFIQSWVLCRFCTEMYWDIINILLVHRFPTLSLHWPVATAFGQRNRAGLLL